MTTVQQLVDSISLQIRDSTHNEVEVAHLQSFINDAAQDARNSGWYVRLEDDESITIAGGIYSYAVPTGFVYINELRTEDTSFTPSVWMDRVPEHFWEIRKDGGIAVLFFEPTMQLPLGKRLKVIGQRRPTVYNGLSDVIDFGMESFLRDRAAAFALMFMAAGVGELDRTRLQLSEIKFRNSEMLLARHPMEFRTFPNSHYVPEV